MTSELAQRDGGSFRDPSGFVFKFDGRVFRTVSKQAESAYLAIRENEAIAALLERQWITSFSEVPETSWDALGVFDLVEDKPAFVLEHPRLPFVSYPYEWTFSQLQHAAVRHLDIQLRALKGNLALSDSSSYNMQFVGTEAVHIDTLSFRPYEDGEIWVGYDQFCRHFLYPLLFEHYTGVAFNKLLQPSLEGIAVSDLNALVPTHRRMFSIHYYLHVVLRHKAEAKTHRLDELKNIAARKLPRKRLEVMLEDMKAWISQLQSNVSQSYWHDYAKRNSYEQKEAELKSNFVGSYANDHKPELLIDLGGNTGEYAAKAIEFGAKRAVVVDGDLGALSHCYDSAKKHKLPITPVYNWLTDPSPNRGWNQAERQGFNHRAKADGVLALALVHHLAIGGNVPLDQAVNWILDKAPTGVIEFVPKTDSMVKRMLATRRDIFSSYSLETMTAAISRRGNIIRQTELQESGRVLLEYTLGS